MASPLYSTGIGLVMEGIAKYENDLRRGKIQEDDLRNGPIISTETTVETEVETETEVDDEPKKTRTKKSFTLGDIITRISGMFESDNID